MKEKNQNRIYLFYPGFYKGEVEVTKDNEFIKSIEEAHAYEVDEDVCNIISRKFLFKNKLVVKSDHYKKKDQINVSNYTTNFYLSVHTKSMTSIVIVEVLNYDDNITLLLDQVSKKEIVVKYEDQDKNEVEMNLREYLTKEVDVELVGKARTMVSTDKEPDKELMKYILSSEGLDSDIDFGNLKNDALDAACSNNLSSYSFTKFYGYKTSVLQIIKQTDNLEVYDVARASTIFMIELLMFKDAAINILNKRTVDSFQIQSNDIFNRVEENNDIFAKLIDLWEIDIFKYPSTQEEIFKLNDVFGIDKSYQKYKRNLAFLEKVIQNKKNKQDEKNALFLNILVLFLSFVQVFGVVYVIVDAISSGSIGSIEVISGSIYSVLLIVFIVSYFLIKKRK